MDHTGMTCLRGIARSPCSPKGGEVIERRIRTEPERLDAVLGTRLKTDRRDARGLAEAGLLGAYRPAHRLSDPQRHVRGRPGVRDALVRTRTRYISLIRALLRQHGYRMPSGSAESFVRPCSDPPLPGRLLSVVAPMLAVMCHLNRQLVYSDATIENLAVHCACRLLDNKAVAS